MKKILLISILVTSQLFSQVVPPRVDPYTKVDIPLRSVQNLAFTTGESLTYRIHYGFLDAGTATLKVEEGAESINGRGSYKIVGTGKSLGTFDFFFKVRDHYETHIDKVGLFPIKFKRVCNEGGYKINQEYQFLPQKSAFKNIKGEWYSSPNFVQDMVSSYYYLRTLNWSKAKVGDVYKVVAVVDDEICELRMKFIGVETIKIDIGTFKCLKFVPVVQKGRVFKDEEDLKVWITDDLNHIPILAQADILVGSIKMELQSYSGIRNKMSKL